MNISEKPGGYDYVFVIDYPVSVRPFYHMRHPEYSDLTMSFDLLYRGVEITTGAQREHRPDVLRAQAREKGLDLEVIQFYLDFFKYGCPPHGGFGFGLVAFAYGHARVALCARDDFFVPHAQ